MIGRVIARVLKGAVLGAVLSAAPWLVAYAAKKSTAPDRDWGLLFAFVFAFIGAIVGAIGALVFSGLEAASGAASKHIDRPTTNTDPLNLGEWENPANWSGGVFYHSRLDKRVLVPKRLRGFGYTVNLAQPGGRIVLAVLVGAALIAIALGLRD